MHNKTLIIAEAGVNHNGDIDLAKRLIDIAAEAGADLVKFQTFNANRQVTRVAKKANYQRFILR
jgi:N,N'-diacetyllegionaminate synthase